MSITRLRSALFFVRAFVVIFLHLDLYAIFAIGRPLVRVRCARKRSRAKMAISQFFIQLSDQLPNNFGHLDRSDVYNSCICKHSHGGSRVASLQSEAMTDDPIQIGGAPDGRQRMTLSPQQVSMALSMLSSCKLCTNFEFSWRNHEEMRACKMCVIHSLAVRGAWHCPYDASRKKLWIKI